MGIYVNDNGTLRNIVGVYVNDNGTLRQMVSVYANDNGTLREIPVTPIHLEDATYSDQQVIPGTARIDLRFNSNGNLETAEAPAGFVTQYAWLLAGSASDYELDVHVASGSFSGGSSATDTWLPLSTSRTYIKSTTSIGSSDVTATYRIRRASDSEVVATATITLRATGL